MATNNLGRILEDEKFRELIKVSLGDNQKFETFTGQRQLIPIAMDYVMQWKYDSHSELRALVVHIEDLADLAIFREDPSRCRSLFEELMSIVQELRAVFTVPKQKMPNTSPADWGPKEEVTIVIHFLLQILEKLMDLMPEFLPSSSMASFKILQTELEFLITFLGDAPMRLQGGDVELTQNVLEDIRVFVNQVGTFLYEIFSTVDDQFIAADRLHLALSDLSQKYEALKEKITDHCTVVSKLQGSVAIKNGVSPLFIVDSLLDDLKDLIDYKADSFSCMKELVLLRSSLDNISLAQLAGPPEEIVVPIRDLVYEIEYVINSSPPWYLSLRVPQFLDKIQIIRMAIQEKYNCGGISIEEEYPPDEQQTSKEEATVFVGFQNEATQITEKLNGGPLQQQIISLVGMPGLGKTTLAKKLFNDPSIVHYFHKRAWCVVSQTYELRNLLIEILVSTRDQNREKIMQMEEDELGEELYKSLKRMRYLIIFDDIWDIQPWDDLKRYLPDDGTGSRIIFTTRNSDVGLRASPSNIIALPFLSDNESWELMKLRLFPSKPCPKNLLEIGKQISMSCHGLPLSVTLIASVLANMPKNESSWETVAGNLSTHLLDNANNCLNVLKLSYQHLPSHLKPCFLWFGAFKEDEVIPVRKLISLWVAEGFIKKEDNKSLEDVAHSYLKNLISRGLVLISGRRSNGGIKTCIIHDLLHDMCVRIAKEENIMKDTEKRLSRHEQDIDRWVYGSSTRSFGLYAHSHLGRRRSDFRFSSKGSEMMVHLRFLEVESELQLIKSSKKLEYLHVGNTSECGIPETVLKMEKLRHLHFKGGAHFRESCCLRANKGDSFQMNNIRSISTLCIYYEMDAKLLGCTPNLRRLKCKFINQCPFNFPNQIESLNIKSIRDPVPNFPVSLTELTLKDFYLSWSTIRMIGRLQNLEVLKLKDGSIKEKNWETEEGEFQNLKFLELSNVSVPDSDYSVKWNPEADHYPKLQRLVLRKCYSMLVIPSSLGYISTLQTIEVHGGTKHIANSAMAILEEQKEFGNEELRVIISS